MWSRASLGEQRSGQEERNRRSQTHNFTEISTQAVLTVNASRPPDPAAASCGCSVMSLVSSHISDEAQLV